MTKLSDLMQGKSLRQMFEAAIDAPVDSSPTYNATECATCQGMGFIILIDKRKLPGEDGWNTPTTCPNPDCPVVARNRLARYERIVARGPLPAEYRELTFDSWGKLPSAHLTGKWLALGAALALFHARSQDFYFTWQDAANAVQVGRDVYTPPNDWRKNSLVLSGAPGLGKTSLLSCIVNALRPEYIPVLYERVANVTVALREPMQDDEDRVFDYGNTEAQIADTFMKAPVLGLDEMNLTRASDYSKQKLEDIIRYRAAHHLPTVITTNLNEDEFNEHWGYRTGHAVQGMAHWVEIRGIDLRRRGRREVSF